MQIIGQGTETYLYLSGLSTLKEIPLYEGIVLAPVTSEFHFKNVENALKMLKSEADFAVVMLSGRTIKSQLHIRASDGMQGGTAFYLERYSSVRLWVISNVISRLKSWLMQHLSM